MFRKQNLFPYVSHATKLETSTSETMFPHDVFAKAWLKRKVAETLFLVKGLAKLGNMIIQCGNIVAKANVSQFSRV